MGTTESAKKTGDSEPLYCRRRRPATPSRAHRARPRPREAAVRGIFCGLERSIGSITAEVGVSGGGGPARFDPTISGPALLPPMSPPRPGCAAKVCWTGPGPP